MLGIMAAYLPSGWPAGVHPPGSEGFEQTAITWLLDVVPPDYRLHGVLLRHPLALAALARHHLAACVAGARQGYRTARTELGPDLPPGGVAAVLDAYQSEGRRLVATARAVDLVGRALHGEKFVPQLSGSRSTTPGPANGIRPAGPRSTPRPANGARAAEPRGANGRAAISRPAGPRPAGPRPAGPHPADPHPVGPHPAGPHPAGAHPADPHPVGPHPADPRIADAIPAQTRRAGPRRAEPRRADPRSGGTRSAQPHPAEPHQATPDGTEPRRASPGPAASHPTEAHATGPHTVEPRPAAGRQRASRPPARAS